MNAAALGLLALLAAAATIPRPGAAPGTRVPPQETEGTACPPARAVEPAPGDALFRWRAEPGLEGLARRLSETAATGPLPGIGPPEDVLPGRPEVWLLRDLSCLSAHGLGSPRPDWVDGVAGRLMGPGPGFIALRVDLAQTSPDELRAVLRHELAHVALARATGGRAPRWLQEGYAQYAAGDWDLEAAWTLRMAILRGGGDVLRELALDFPDDAQRARLAYLLSYTAVHELAELAGPTGLRALFRELRRGASVDGGLRRVFGITEDQFRERWRQRVENRYGILYILSRATVFWVLVALAVAWAGWRRRKRDREKMARLKEEERAWAATVGWEERDPPEPDAR